MIGQLSAIWRCRHFWLSLVRIDLRTREELDVDASEQIRGMHVPEVALLGMSTPDRRAHRLDDHRTASVHLQAPSSVSSRLPFAS